MRTFTRVFISLTDRGLLIACESPRSGAESALAPGIGGIQVMSFTSSRPGGSGGNDLWMSTRGPSGVEAP